MRIRPYKQPRRVKSLGIAVREAQLSKREKRRRRLQKQQSLQSKAKSSKRKRGVTIADYAHKMRHSMTPPESRLWRPLKTIGFEAQVVLLQKYIADFYLEPKRVVVEVDGSYHQDHAQLAKDAKRDEDMRKAGITVLRFTAKQVFRDADSVLREIAERISTPKSIAADVLSESACRQNTPTNTASVRDAQECRPGNTTIRERSGGRASGELVESSALQG